MAYPDDLDTFPEIEGADRLKNLVSSKRHSLNHTNLGAAVNALEAKVGVNDSAVATSHEFRITALEDGGGGGGLSPAQNIFGAAGATTAPSIVNQVPLEMVLPDGADPGFVTVDGAGTLTFTARGLYAISVESEGNPADAPEGNFTLQGSFSILGMTTFFYEGPYGQVPPETMWNAKNTALFMVAAGGEAELFYTTDQGQITTVFVHVTRIGTY